MDEKKLAYSGDLQPRQKGPLEQLNLDGLDRNMLLGDIVYEPAPDKPEEPGPTYAELMEILRERQKDMSMSPIAIGGNPLDPHVGYIDEAMDEEDG